MEFDHSEILLLKESKGTKGNKFCFYRAYVNLDFSIHNGFGDRVLDGELLVLEVDGVPFQAHGLLSSQSVIGRHRHRELQRRSFHPLQKNLRLLLPVEAMGVGPFFGLSALSAGSVRMKPFLNAYWSAFLMFA